MVSSFFRCVFVAMIFVFAVFTSAVAQQPEVDSSVPPRLVKAGVYLSPPFVMEENGRYTGMAIELWEMLAQPLGLQTDYVRLETLGDLVDAAASVDVDVAVTNLTITRDRAERIDFTHPWFDAGLRIMINEDRGTGFRDMFQGLQASGHLRAYAWIAAVIVVATILLTLFDRRFDKNFPKRWRDGIAESFYSVMSVATSGKPVAQEPVRLGRAHLAGAVAGLWPCGSGLCDLVGHERHDDTFPQQPNPQCRGSVRAPGRRVHGLGCRTICAWRRSRRASLSALGRGSPCACFRRGGGGPRGRTRA